MDDGDTCVCLYDDWYNAFGEQSHAVHEGVVLTVRSTVRVGGLTFLEFYETPEGTQFLSHGFRPHSRRTLN